tara:strand:- start:1153 stop:1815 length:663 start_codon:yes stop_codon:yes gene_type:complete
MTINVPTSWESVTLRKYQSITALFKEAEEKGNGLEGSEKELHDYHTECALISTLTDTPMDEILSLHRGAHNRIMNELGFLSTPIEGKVKTRIKVNGNRYYFEKNARKINGGQWISIMHFLEDENKIDENLHNLLACFASRYKWFRARYDGKIHNEIAEDLKDIPITVVKPLTDFFLKDWLKSVQNMAVFLEIKGRQLKRKAERMLARSKADTDGSTPLTD